MIKIVSTFSPRDLAKQADQLAVGMNWKATGSNARAVSRNLVSTAVLGASSGSTSYWSPSVGELQGAEIVSGFFVGRGNFFVEFTAVTGTFELSISLFARGYTGNSGEFKLFKWNQTINTPVVGQVDVVSFPDITWNSVLIEASTGAASALEFTLGLNAVGFFYDARI